MGEANDKGSDTGLVAYAMSYRGSKIKCVGGGRKRRENICNWNDEDTQLRRWIQTYGVKEALSKIYLFATNRSDG